MTVAKSSISIVTLIPWDPESQSHIDRLYQQRIACGWNKELIPQWIEKQRQGKKAIQWIALSPDDEARSEMEFQHISAYPSEEAQLLDTAISLRGKPCKPSGTSFLPIGHISLDSDVGNTKLANPEEGIYLISTFYVSRALHSCGLGRAAMDLVEKMAVDEPLCAKILTLDTIANEYPGREERLKALGRSIPKVSNADWYTRRGYQIYGQVENTYWETDSTGKAWPATAVLMKKKIT